MIFLVKYLFSNFSFIKDGQTSQEAYLKSKSSNQFCNLFLFFLEIFLFFKSDSYSIWILSNFLVASSACFAHFFCKDFCLAKILGFIGGLLEGYVVAFVILFFLTQPAFSFQFFQDSNLSQKILTSSPVLTDITKDTVEVVKEIYALKDEKDTKLLNQKSLDIMLEHGMVTYDTAKKLSYEGKINVEGIDEVLNKHKGDK